eukprot:scaffold133658_cov30-Tisochrysis_lutea.AAC.4
MRKVGRSAGCVPGARAKATPTTSPRYRWGTEKARRSFTYGFEASSLRSASSTSKGEIFSPAYRGHQRKLSERSQAPPTTKRPTQCHSPFGNRAFSSPARLMISLNLPERYKWPLEAIIPLSPVRNHLPLASV